MLLNDIPFACCTFNSSSWWCITPLTATIRFLSIHHKFQLSNSPLYITKSCLLPLKVSTTEFTNMQPLKLQPQTILYGTNPSHTLRLFGSITQLPLSAIKFHTIQLYKATLINYFPLVTAATFFLALSNDTIISFFYLKASINKHNGLPFPH